MENFLLGSGFSWTMSKILPFVILLLFGVILCFVIRKVSSKKWIRLSAFLLILLPVTIYFVLNPIFEGDFSNEFKTEKVADDYKELERDNLTVITIPHCKFCSQAIDAMLTVTDRISSKKKINLIVCSSNLADLKEYKKKSKSKLNVKLAKNVSAMVLLAGGKFPAFVFTDKSGEMKIWSNEGFGVTAKDWIEAKLREE